MTTVLVLGALGFAAFSIVLAVAGYSVLSGGVGGSGTSDGTMRLAPALLGVGQLLGACVSALLACLCAMLVAWPRRGAPRPPGNHAHGGSHSSCCWL